MRILYAANSRFPSERAHSIQIVHNCQAFAEAGHEVLLLVTDRETSITKSAESYYGFSFAFVVRHLKIFDMAGRSDRTLRLFHRFTMTVQRLQFALQVARQSEMKEADILYSRDEWVLWFCSWFVPKEKLVYESHEAKFNFPARRLLRAGVPCIAISEGIKRAYTKVDIPSDQILVAHDGIDKSFFEPPISQAEARQQLGIDTTKPVVMYIGGFDVWKGVDTLCEAAGKGDFFAVYIIGGSEEHIAHYQTKYPDVTFLGSRPYKELPHTQQAADVLVVPNTAATPLSAEYTSPLKLFAHMTSGIPMVVSDIPSIRTVLSENEAYFAEPDNPSSFATVIDTVVANKEQSAKRAQAAQVKSRMYTWTFRVHNILDFFAYEQSTR